MTSAEFIAARKGLKLSQFKLALLIGVSNRTIQSIEASASPVRRVHALALERLALDLAVDMGDPTAAPPAAREAALALARALREPRENVGLSPARGEARS